MTLTYPDVLPGTIGLTSVSGRTGKFIRFSQYLVRNPWPLWLKRNNEPEYQHSFTYLGATETYPEGALMEAEPGGARIRSVTEYATIYWCKHIAEEYAADLPEVVEHAPVFTGTPYSFLDYLALAVHRLHLWAPGLKHYIETTHHMICSQMCDWLYDLSGVKLFADRWYGDVMPIDFYYLDWMIENQKIALGL